MEATVRDETVSALTKTGIIREEESAGFKDYLRTNKTHVGNILPKMAELRGIEEGEHPASVANWARAMAPIVKKRYPLVPFAGRIHGSAALFEQYSEIEEAAAAVKCPLIFAEDTDVFRLRND